MPSFWAAPANYSPDWERYYYLAVLCRAAYDSTEAGRIAWATAVGAGGSGRVAAAPGSAAPGMDYVYMDDCIILCWHGCTDYRQALDFLMHAKWTSAGLGMPGRVSQFVRNLFLQAKAAVDTLLASTPASYKVVLTGHSLGGSIAQLMGAYIKAQPGGDGRVAGVYSFGSPKVGDRAWAEFCDFPSFNLRNQDDVVPCYPPSEADGTFVNNWLLTPPLLRVWPAMKYREASRLYRMPLVGSPHPDLTRFDELTYEQIVARYPRIVIAQLVADHSIEQYASKLLGVIGKPSRTPFDGQLIDQIQTAYNTAGFVSNATPVAMPTASIGGLAGQQIPPPPLPQVPPPAAIRQTMIVHGPRTSQNPIRTNVPGQPPRLYYGADTDNTPQLTNVFRGYDHRMLNKGLQVFDAVLKRDGHLENPTPSSAISNRQYMVPPEQPEVLEAITTLQLHFSNLLAQHRTPPP